MEDRWHYMTVSIMQKRLEHVLNNLEDMASGMYEIVSILPEAIGVLMLVVRLRIIEEEAIFDEAEIKRRLGFEE